MGAMTIRLAIAARTDVGRVRRRNEDALLVANLPGDPLEVGHGVVRFEVSERGALLVVSDGMGGHKAGDVASALTVSSVHRELVERTSLPGPEARVESAVVRANREVLAAGGAANRSGMGSTLTAIVIDGERAHVAQVGDSRAYLLRGGVIRQLTHDQSMVQVLVDTGEIAPEEAQKSPMRNVLLQALGQRPNIKVALATLALRDRDCLLLCSDGLSGKLSPEEIRDAVLSSPSLDVAAERLIGTANERGGEDNITVLLAGVGGGAPPLDSGERISDTFQVLTTFDPTGKR